MLIKQIIAVTTLIALSTPIFAGCSDKCSTEKKTTKSAKQNEYDARKNSNVSSDDYSEPKL